MRGKWISLAFVGCAVLFFCGRFLFGGIWADSSYLYSDLKIDENKFVVIDEKDTHGGFLGDGTYYIKLDCSENYMEIEDIMSEWPKLPLTRNLEIVLYGGERDGVAYAFDFAEDVGIPKPEHGRYFFIDRHREAKDRYSDSGLLDRYSFNFSVAIYDSDKKMLYYLREDT